LVLAQDVPGPPTRAVRHYIQNQQEHHRRHSFEEEFLVLLEKSGAAFNKTEVFY
jgi:hypothetical protein